jgi:PTS system mannose-specific IIA component
MNRILIIAHAPLATAMRQCALHVFPDCGNDLAALDVQPNMPPEETQAQARILLEQLDAPHTLLLTDLFGATPCNVAQRLSDGPQRRLVAGLNLPMLLRALSYRHEPLEQLVQRVVNGGTQGVLAVATSRPQHQTRSEHDSTRYHDQ